MDNEYIILEGKDYEKLLEQGMKHFNTSKENLLIEVLESKKSLFTSYYKIRMGKADNKTLDHIESSIENILKEGIMPRNKNIEFKFMDDGVYVKVESGVTMVDIVTQIDMKRIQSVDISKLKQGLDAGNFDSWIKIAESQEEKRIDGECRVIVSKDGMKAFINLSKPIGGADINEKNIYEALKISHVVFNIKENEIKSAVENKLYDKDILIAEGIEPLQGQDAVLTYHFDTSNEKPAILEQDGKVDYHELSLIKNVKAGDLLVTLTPHTNGVRGKNVLGEDVPGKDGKKLVLPKGKNVEISADGLTLVSAIDGEVKILDGKVNAFSIYEVKHNVDNSTGNIRFNGKVIVMGNVLTGFVIEAEGDVEVYGVVEGALIRSESNIILHRGIQGMNRGELYCSGDLIAKFIENSKIEVKGNIQSDAIMHSQVVCGKKLEVSGRKGLLVGGSFKVGEEIKAKVIGSPMATLTEIEVGINPDMRKRYEDIKIELKQINENLDKTTKAVDLLTKMSKSMELPVDKKLLLAKSLKLKLQLQQSLDQVINDQNEMEKYFEELSRGKVRVNDIIYPGCRIIIGNSSMHIKDSVKYVSFYRINADIRMGSYDEVH